MKKILPFLTLLTSVLMLWSCDEETPAAGGSLVSGQVEIIRDSVFTLTGVPYTTDAVRSRTILQLLGRYSAEGFGRFDSDIVCQYMPSSSIDTVGVKRGDIDSVKLCLMVYKGGFAGDSVAPMGLSVHRLTRQLPTPIYSDFDPAGYYDAAPIGSTTYSGLLSGYPYVGADSEGSLFKYIYVDLPVELGRELYDKYVAEPAVFNSPKEFASWFPGLYITNTFGSGRVTRISSNTIDVYYHATETIGEGEEKRDTVLNLQASYLGVTPEVLTNNNITYDMAPALRERAARGEAIMVGPVGYDVEFTFPAREILRRYNEQSGPLAVVNSLSFSIPAEDISNDYGLTPPPYVLMVKKSKKEEFFAKNQLTDNVNSFYASYNATTGRYTFASMLDYIDDIIEKGTVEPEDEEFVLCPVLVSFYSSSATSSSDYYYAYYYGYSYNTSSTQVSSITPYVTEPVMTRLDFSKAKVEFSFSKQTL